MRDYHENLEHRVIISERICMSQEIDIKDLRREVEDLKKQLRKSAKLRGQLHRQINMHIIANQDLLDRMYWWQK